MTEAFANLAQIAARARGVEPLPLLVLPHPMEMRPADEIERICEARFEEAVRSLVSG